MGGLELILAAICLNATCDATQQPITNIKNQIPMTLEGLGDNGESMLVKAQKFKEMRNELSGKKLKVVSLEDPPLSYTKIVNGTRVGMGVSFEILEFLTEKFNFTYELIIPEKNTVGSTNDMEGSLLQILRDDKADLGAAFLPILSDARKHIAYSTTTLDEGEWIMIMLRPAESASGSGLLAPFDRDVWLLILFSLLAVGPIIYLLIIFRYKITKEKTQKMYPLPHCIWFVYGALMKQGSTLSPVAG